MPAWNAFQIYLFVVAAGSFTAVQAGANSQLRKSLDQPLIALLCVYATALIPLAVAALFRLGAGVAPEKVSQVPWWAWLGGLLSVVSTIAGLLFAEKLGSLSFTSVAVTASLICGMLLDHFGWVGFETHRVNPGRLAGCALLLGGVFLVSKF